MAQPGSLKFSKRCEVFFLLLRFCSPKEHYHVGDKSQSWIMWSTSDFCHVCGRRQTRQTFEVCSFFADAKNIQRTKSKRLKRPYPQVLHDGSIYGKSIEFCFNVTVGKFSSCNPVEKPWCDPQPVASLH